MKNSVVRIVVAVVIGVVVGASLTWCYTNGCMSELYTAEEVQAIVAQQRVGAAR